MAKQRSKKKSGINWGEALAATGSAGASGVATGLLIGNTASMVDPMWTGIGSGLLGGVVQAYGKDSPAIAAAGAGMTGVGMNEFAKALMPGMYGAPKVSGIGDSGYVTDDYEEYGVSGTEGEGIAGADDEGIAGTDEDDDED